MNTFFFQLDDFVELFEVVRISVFRNLVPEQRKGRRDGEERTISITVEQTCIK